jgi:hypothetical protein
MKRGTFLGLVLLLAAGAARAETMALNLQFESQHQSIWGPGSAPAPSTTVWTIVDPNRATWSTQSSGYPNWTGPMWTFDTYLFGEKELGFAWKGAVGGSAGLWTTLTIVEPGSYDVSYPVEAVLTFPDQNSFRAGDTVEIGSSYAVKPGWGLTTHSPAFTLSTDAEFQMLLDFQAKAELLATSVSTNDFPGFSDLGLPLTAGPGRFNIFTVDQNSKLSTPPQLGLLIPLSAKIEVPKVATTASLKADRSIVADGQHEFGKLDIDLDKAFTMLVKKPPLGIKSSYAGVTIDTHLFDLHSVTTLTAKQHVGFDPDLRVVFNFAEPLEHWTSGPGGNTTPQTASSVEMAVGDTLHVNYPADKKQPTAISPSFRLDGEVTSKADVTLGEDIPALALKLGITIPSFEIVPELCTPGGCVDMGLFEVCVPEICTPSVDFPGVDVTEGPVWQTSLYKDGYTFPALVDRKWPAEGFSTQSGTGFALDPENPIVRIEKAVGGTRNLGGGHRLVSYMLTFSNPGDVLLSSLHLEDDLAAAFPGARSFQVDNVIGCTGVTLNPAWSGVADVELLANGNTLAPAARKQVAIVASVYPQANPPEYVNTAGIDGTSPLGTVVSNSASAGVTLGPDVIESLDDYVVFGEHFVKIEGIADSVGTIGSNDFVEVKRGSSGILAGDLRAGGFIKVQGTLTADYAFSAGVIDEAGGGRLSLSGDAKPFTTVEPFTLLSAPPAPLTKGAPDVFVPASGSLTLPAGTYRRVTVARNATLSLAGGSYVFEELTAGTNARIRFDAEGDATVRQQLDLDSGAALDGYTTRTALMALQPGEISIGSQARVRGVLSAPLANVTFHERSQLEGAAYARSVTLRNGVSVRHHVECNRALDRDCDAIPDCF